MSSLFTRLLHCLGVRRNGTRHCGARPRPRPAGRRDGRHAASRWARHAHGNPAVPTRRPIAATPSSGTCVARIVASVVVDALAGADAVSGWSTGGEADPAASQIHTAINGRIAAITTPEATLWLINGTLRCADHQYPLAQFGTALTQLFAPPRPRTRPQDNQGAARLPAAA